MKSPQKKKKNSSEPSIKVGRNKSRFFVVGKSILAKFQEI